MVIKHNCFWILRNILFNIILCDGNIYVVCVFLSCLQVHMHMWVTCACVGWRLALAVFHCCSQHCCFVAGSLTVPGHHSLSKTSELKGSAVSDYTPVPVPSFVQDNALLMHLF